MPAPLFYLLAALALLGAGFVVLHPNPVKSALALILVMFVLALIYLGLSASFLAVIQVMVYAGAVMVLFLFVLFLLNVGVESPFAVRPLRRWIAALVGTLVGLLLASLVLVRFVGPGAGPGAPGGGFGGIESTGRVLLTRYLLPFELLSVLLLAAIVGAMLATRPRWPTLKMPPELRPSRGPEGEAEAS
jgi:NADH-quinone oxidoreductase subunit J